MLSRLSFRNIASQVKAIGTCGIQTTGVVPSSMEPRPKRQVESSPVRMGFIPDEWFQFFYPKTGVTGPYVFLTSVSTYLVSKEWYVMEHEYYSGLSLLSIIVYVHFKFGDKIAAYLDKEVDKVEEELNNNKNEAIMEHQEAIDGMEREKWRTEAEAMIYDIKKQNIWMQLEACYRERLATVHKQVKTILDYHAQMDTINRRIGQKHMVQWITSNVLKAITPEQEKASLLQCIKELQTLSAKA